MMMSGDYTPSAAGGDYDPVGSLSPKGRKGVKGLPKPRRAKQGGIKGFGKASVKSGKRSSRRK